MSIKRTLLVFAAILSSLFVFTSCEKEQDIENENYFFGITVYFPTQVAVDANQDLITIAQNVLDMYDEEFKKLEGYNALANYMFRLKEKTYTPAIEAVQAACKTVEANIDAMKDVYDINAIVKAMGFSFAVGISVTASDLTVANVYGIQFGVN